MWIMVDVESDGPMPGDYSMISLGAVVVERNPADTFLMNIKPISDKWLPEALAISGYTRAQTLNFKDPLSSMGLFNIWLNDLIKKKKDNRLMLISDNNGYDAAFINFYFWKFLNKNPFGHSSTNLGSLYKGCVKSMYKNFKHLRRTKHTHNPIDDAMGNVEALLQIVDKFNLKGFV